MNPPLNLMLDIETVATCNNAGIISIAFVPFYHSYPELPCYYERILSSSLEERGFIFNRETLEWWDKQNPNVRSEAFGGTKDISSVLQDICQYFRDLPDCTRLVWGKGSDFDNSIVADAFDICGIPLPWNFRNNRCFRTLEELFGEHCTFKPTNTANKHNALADAEYQAKRATEILLHLKGEPK